MEHQRGEIEPGLARLRELANAIDCFCEPDLRALTGWTEETARQRRKRGDGPPYILIGKNYFYPRAATLQHFKARTADRRTVSAASIL